MKTKPNERANHKRYRDKTRQTAIDHLGGICIECGFSDPRALQFDHINGCPSDERKWTQVKTFLDVLKYKPNTKYQLLCANCNWIKRYTANECTGPKIYTDELDTVTV